MNKPLSYKMRPQTLENFIGQKHLTSEDGIITKMLSGSNITSMILYGPSGCGKTSLAYIIVARLSVYYEYFNAAVDNKKKLTEIVEIAKQYDGIVMIVDEIHRMKRDIQDVLLPYVENGLITLIGLTTENPYYSINKAIRSRSLLIELYPLTDNEILEGVKNAIAETNNEKHSLNLTFTTEALEYIVKIGNGDLRRSLGILEAVTITATPNENITKEKIEQLFLSNNYFMDYKGDSYYDTLSAFQKSIRGSDVDAALHYLARLIESGDLESICRRLIVIAYEDIGLGNVEACQRAYTATEAAIKVGFPEARIILANTVCELALSPKSTTTYQALDRAIKELKETKATDIPNFVKYNPLDKRGKELLKTNKLFELNYLPDNLKKSSYFKYKENGSEYEQKLAKNYKILQQKKNK